MSRDRIADANHARAELYETLALLTDRLNYAQRFDDAVERRVENIKEFKEQRPLAFAAGVVGVAMVAGAGVWAVTRIILKKVK